MIGLQVANGWLVLAPGSINMLIKNPAFSTDSVPGTITLPFALPFEGNLEPLNFPHVRAEQGEQVLPEPVNFYIDGQLRWVGALVYLDCDEERRQFTYNFVADAADLQSRIDGVSLTALDLGRVPLVLGASEPDYALPCVRNAGFYGDKLPSYCGVVNYFQGDYNSTPGSKRSPLVPYLRFIPLLRRVLGAVGYALSGPWLDDPEAQRLVIYSDRAVENADGTLPADFAVNRHVPDITVAQLLVDAQKFFGLAYRFHPVRREMSVRALRDIIADPAYLDRVGGRSRTTAVTSTGFVLKMELEDDELNKTLDTSWQQLRLGASQTTITTEAGTLHVVREKDALAFNNREWLVPAVLAKGASLAFGVGDDSRCGLRFLFDRGLCPDSVGNVYPLATWGRTDYTGATVGLSTLHWEGEDGLYATWHREWLAFLDRATTRVCTMQFRVADLLTLDPTRKEMVNYRKYLWEQVSLTLKTTGSQLEEAAFTYRYTTR